MLEDAQLLRQFVVDRSEAAFAEIVQRHIDLVYHAAARQLGADAHLAADVAQGVFVLLAEKSPGLLGHPSVAGWLHTTAHLKVSEVLRVERRRRRREEAARIMNEAIHEAANDAEWARLRPVIDAALGELSAGDREAVLLRFFENQPFAQIAVRLRLNENAAHKRVERALEKLRERLARRGVTSTAAALATVLGGQAAVAAPAGLAASVTDSVVASGLPVVASFGAVSFMSTKTTVAVAALLVLLAGGFATYEAAANRATSAEVVALSRENEALATRVRQARARLSSVAQVPMPAVAKPQPPAPPTSAAASKAFFTAHPEFRDAFERNMRAIALADCEDFMAMAQLSDAEREQMLAIRMKGMVFLVGGREFTFGDEGYDMDRQLREFLGDMRYEQFLAYQRLAPARQLADELTRALYYTDLPLTPTQADQLKLLVGQALSDLASGSSYPTSFRNLPPSVWDAVLAQAPGVLADVQLSALRDVEQQARFSRTQAVARNAYLKASSTSP